MAMNGEETVVERALELLTLHCVPMAMQAAVKLNVLDILASADQELSATKIVARMKLTFLRKNKASKQAPIATHQKEGGAMASTMALAGILSSTTLATSTPLTTAKVSLKAAPTLPICASPSAQPSADHCSHHALLSLLASTTPAVLYAKETLTATTSIKVKGRPPPSGGLPGIETAAIARAKDFAQDIVNVKSLIDRKAWAYLINDLRLKASYLCFDLNTIIASKSKAEKKALQRACVWSRSPMCPKMPRQLIFSLHKFVIRICSRACSHLIIFGHDFWVMAIHVAVLETRTRASFTNLRFFRSKMYAHIISCKRKKPPYFADFGAHRECNRTIIVRLF